MRSEILKILDSYSASAVKNLPLTKGELYLISERELAISELTALMCYREVRRIIKSRIWNGYKDILEWPNNHLYPTILSELECEYPDNMAIQAIEQVKKEMKW